MSKDIVLVFVVLCVNVALIGIDIAFDLYDGNTLTHISIEAVAFLLSVVGLIALTSRFMTISSQYSELKRIARNTTAEKDEWKAASQKYSSGFGAAIEKQMELWGFTCAEKEIALMLLKGCSFKEIATLRNTGERTARQQALDIYRKGRLAGRAELSAFFLEDVLAPQEKEAPDKR